MSSQTPRPSRLSGIPTPGRPSGIPSSSGLPTPSRRKSSLVPSDAQLRAASTDDETLSRAFNDAIRNPPSSFRSPSVSGSNSETGGMRRPGSAASHSSTHSFHSSNGGGGPGSALGMPSPPTLPRTPGMTLGRQPSLRTAVSQHAPSTPTAKSFHTPRRSLAPTGLRPPSRQEEERPPPMPKSTRSGVNGGSGGFSVGDKVRVDSMGMEGTLRFVGEIEGKPGTWAGVELSGGFAGRGKNDGSVGG